MKIITRYLPYIPFRLIWQKKNPHTPLRMINVVQYYTLWNFQHILCRIKSKHVTHNAFTSSPYNVNSGSEAIDFMHPNSFLEPEYFLLFPSSAVFSV